MRARRSWGPTWIEARNVRPVGFPMVTPPPVRGVALQVVVQLVGELVEERAVDGATGDVLDELIDSWHSQWRSGLVAELTGRQALLQRLLAIAGGRVAKAHGRVASTRKALDGAQSAYDLAVAPAAPAIDLRKASNGVLHHDSHH